jgi:hypothetical protein
MHCCHTCRASNCPATVSRRGFLAGMAAASAATEVGLMDFASSLFAADAAAAEKPVVSVVFIRPEEPVVISWPGGNCDVAAQQALFTKTLNEAAGQLGVQLDVQAKPIDKAEQVAQFLTQIGKKPPDGLIVCAMELTHWPLVDQIVQKRGDVPTIVYSNLSAFTSHLQATRSVPKTFVGATQDVGWLAYALRMLNAIWRMRHTRILFVAGAENKETKVPSFGTVYHWIPKRRFEEEFQRVAVSDEVRAIADFYSNSAEKIVEPTQADILEAAKNYAVCRKLMKNEGCQGIAIDCLGWKNPVCVAYSKLRDEGIVAACEQDQNAAVGMLLVHLLFDRPSFQQDPSPNTVNNTLIGAHCTSPTRLERFGKPYRAPYLLRNYHTRTGVAPEVLWPEGKPVSIVETVLKPSVSIMVGVGKVVANIAQPPSGCCRTSVEITVDGVADTRDVKGFHQLFVLGNLERDLKSFGKLSGIPVTPIC